MGVNTDVGATHAPNAGKVVCDICMKVVDTHTRISNNKRATQIPCATNDHAYYNLARHKPSVRQSTQYL